MIELIPEVIQAWLPSIVRRTEDLNTRLPEDEEDILAIWPFGGRV